MKIINSLLTISVISIAVSIIEWVMALIDYLTGRPEGTAYYAAIVCMLCAVICLIVALVISLVHTRNNEKS